MKKAVFSGLLVVSVVLLAPPVIYPQTSSSSAQTSEIKPKEFPQWAKDLRRAEIVAFGAFPFAWFMTMLFTDLARSAAHGWSDRYWPWPAKPAGAVEMSTGEYGTTLSIAAGLSIIIAVTDHLIVRNKRYYASRRQAENPQSEPIIERMPMFPEEAAEENPAADKAAASDEAAPKMPAAPAAGGNSGN
ncbi:MAG: hypothetical protein LBD20_06655 [Spirochaetaceae bacterium]|jgi:hypothetical protein|nr:hypothetical protein [Spirochaetaceae bacterium]